MCQLSPNPLIPTFPFKYIHSQANHKLFMLCLLVLSIKDYDHCLTTKNADHVTFFQKKVRHLHYRRVLEYLSNTNFPKHSITRGMPNNWVKKVN